MQDDGQLPCWKMSNCYISANI